MAIIRIEQFACCLGCWKILIQNSQQQVVDASLLPWVPPAPLWGGRSCLLHSWGLCILLPGPGSSVSPSFCLQELFGYVLLCKKAEFCPKRGYFQLYCMQLCDQMTCSTISWIIKRWVKESGRVRGRAGLKVGAAQLRCVTILQKLHSWEENGENLVAKIIWD